MLVVEVLILKLLAVNALSSRALHISLSYIYSFANEAIAYLRDDNTHIPTIKIPALKHKLRNHTVELGALVPETHVPRAEGGEVLDRLGDFVVVEVEDDSA